MFLERNRGYEHSKKLQKHKKNAKKSQSGAFFGILGQVK